MGCFDAWNEYQATLYTKNWVKRVKCEANGTRDRHLQKLGRVKCSSLIFLSSKKKINKATKAVRDEDKTEPVKTITYLGERKSLIEHNTKILNERKLNI